MRQCRVRTYTVTIDETRRRRQQLFTGSAIVRRAVGPPDQMMPSVSPMGVTE